MLVADSVVVGYGADPIVRGVSVEVPDGQVVCVLGPNGAGKSTLMKALVGELHVQQGELLLDGERVTHLPPHRRIRKGLGYVPQVRRVFPSLTVRENLEMGAFAVDGPLDSQLARVYALFPDLERDRRRQAGVLSGGQQAMVGIARALMGNARVLLLDEPTAGMSPAYVDRVWERLHAIKDAGLAILMVEQNVALALRNSDIGYVLVNGEVVASESCRQLEGRHDVEGLFVG